MPSLAQPQPVARLSPEEYLAFERASHTRHEYVNGEVYAMGGASLRHATIVSNIAGSLSAQLRGGACRVLVTDMRVKVSRAGDYVYPDVVAVCGVPALEDSQFDTLLNPVLIVEVLSPSTKNYDRGEKWEKYRQIASLRDYIVVAQDRVHVERYTRQGEGFWLLSEESELSATLQLDSIGCTLALRDIYENAFDTPAEMGTPTETNHG